MSLAIIGLGPFRDVGKSDPEPSKPEAFRAKGGEGSNERAPSKRGSTVLALGCPSEILVGHVKIWTSITRRGSGVQHFAVFYGDDNRCDCCLFEPF